MNVAEAIQRLDAFIAAFDTEMMQISEEVALNAKAMIINRIQHEGIGKTYSTKKIPAYLMLLDESRLDTQQTVAFVKVKAKAKKPEDRMVDWADIRQAHGNQTEFVDLTFTGRMFNNVGIITTAKVGNNYVTSVGGFNDETRKKLQWNAQRYGAYFIMIDKERGIIASFLKERVQKIEKKYLGE